MAINDGNPRSVWLLQNDQMVFSNVIPCCEFNDNEGSAKYEDAADADNNCKMKCINQTHSKHDETNMLLEMTTMR